MRPVSWLSTLDASLLSRLRAKDLTRGSLLLPLLGRFLVCYSRPSLPDLVANLRLGLGSSPRFPQVVEKIVEKHSGAPHRDTGSG